MSQVSKPSCFARTGTACGASADTRDALMVSQAMRISDDVLIDHKILEVEYTQLKAMIIQWAEGAGFEPARTGSPP